MKCCVFCSPICDVAEILCEVDASIAVAAVWDVVVVAFEAVVVVVVDVADFVWVDAENRLHDCAESARTIEITPIWRRYMELEFCRIDAFLYRFCVFLRRFCVFLRRFRFARTHERKSWGGEREKTLANFPTPNARHVIEDFLRVWRIRRSNRSISPIDGRYFRE